jgi:hypothetical protein
MKAVLALTIVGGLVLLARRFAPLIRERCTTACEHMLDEMPDAFPPKRMMISLDEIAAQNERVIELLEQQPGDPERAPAA